MICPNCGGDTELIYVLDDHKESFEIDRCAHCGGIWLDKYELERIPAEKAEEIDAESEGYEGLDLLGLNCPHCHIPLEEFHHPRLGETAFLRCPDCRGFWLKRGQLYSYMSLKKPLVTQEETDMLGTLTKRDRVLVTFTSVLLMVMISGLMLSFKVGNYGLSADMFTGKDGSISTTSIILLSATLILFACGLILALFRNHRVIRVLGWGMVLFSILMLFYFSRL